MSIRKSKTILEELNAISTDRDKNHVLENRVQHLVSSAENIRSMLKEMYPAEIADDLERRLFNSIRTGDYTKFSRGIKKAVKESKSNEN